MGADGGAQDVAFDARGNESALAVDDSHFLADVCSYLEVEGDAVGRLRRPARRAGRVVPIADREGRGIGSPSCTREVSAMADAILGGTRADDRMRQRDVAVGRRRAVCSRVDRERGENRGLLFHPLRRRDRGDWREECRDQQQARGHLGICGHTQGKDASPTAKFSLVRGGESSAGPVNTTPTPAAHGWSGSGADPWASHAEGAASINLWMPGQAPTLFRFVTLPLNPNPGDNLFVAITAVRFRGLRDDQKPNNEFVEITRDQSSARFPQHVTPSKTTRGSHACR
jgi:hypothetical protein